MVYLQLKIVAVLVVAVLLVAIRLEDKVVAIPLADSSRHQAAVAAEQGIHIQETPPSSSLNLHDHRINVSVVMVRLHSKDRVV